MPIIEHRNQTCTSFNNPCGSEPAREEGFTSNINVDCQIASRAGSLPQGGGSAERWHYVLDKQFQGFLLLGMRQAVVAPEAELVDAQLLVVLDARDDFFRGADHRGLVQALQFELWTAGEFLFRTRCQEAVDRGFLVAE